MKLTKPTKLTAMQQSLVEAAVHAAAQVAGFFVTEDQAKAEKLRWPTLTQMNNNPVHLVVWGSHPVRNGIVHFSPDTAQGVAISKDHNGWKAARRQYTRYIFERHSTFKGLYVPDASNPAILSLGNTKTPEEYAELVVKEFIVIWKQAWPLYMPSVQITVETLIESLADKN